MAVHRLDMRGETHNIGNIFSVWIYPNQVILCTVFTNTNIFIFITISCESVIYFIACRDDCKSSKPDIYPVTIQCWLTH